MNRKLTAAVISAVMVFGASPLCRVCMPDASAVSDSIQQTTDAQSNAAARKIKFAVDADLVLTDGTALPVQWEFTEEKSVDIVSIKLNVTEDMLKEALDGTDKSVDDISGLRYKVKAAAPDDLVHTPYSYIKYQTSIRYKYFGADGFKMREFASTETEHICFLDDTVTVNEDNVFKNMAADGIDHVDTELSIYLDKARVIEPTQAHLDALTVGYSPKAYIRLKDGTELGTDFAFSPDEDNVQYRSFVTGDIEAEKLIKILEADAKTIDDFDDIVVRFSTDIPQDSEFGEESTITGLTFSCDCDLKVKNGLELEKGTVTDSASKEDKVYGVKADDILIGDCRLLSGRSVAYREEADGVKAVFTRALEFGDIENFSLSARFGIIDAEVVRQENKPVISKGDVDLNGEVNVTDIAMVASHIKGVKPLEGQGLINADVDENGEVNVTDIAMIAAHIKGIKPLV